MIQFHSLCYYEKYHEIVYNIIPNDTILYHIIQYCDIIQYNVIGILMYYITKTHVSSKFSKRH